MISKEKKGEGGITGRAVGGSGRVSTLPCLGLSVSMSGSVSLFPILAWRRVSGAVTSLALPILTGMGNGCVEEGRERSPTLCRKRMLLY